MLIDMTDLTTALRRARRRNADESAYQDVEDRIEGLSELLSALDKIGDRHRAGPVADRLVRAAAGIDQESDGATGPLIEVVQTLAGVGLVDTAERFIATIRHPQDQGATQSNLVAMLANAGDLGRAERIAAAIDDAEARSDAWIGLVGSLTEAGDRAGARRAVQRAEESIAAVSDYGGPVRRLNHLVQVLVAHGYPDDARRVADRAEEVARTVTDPRDHAWALGSAVHAWCFVGEFDRAERLIPGIVDRSARETALFKLSVGRGAAGDFDRGLSIADQLADVGDRSSAQGELVRLMAQAGDFERARSTAAVIASPSARAGALGDLAGALAAAGDQAGSRPVAQAADQVAGDIAYPTTRSLARSGLVEELVEAGDFEQAAATALVPVEGDNPAGDLGCVARGMIQAGDLAGARRILARAEPFALADTGPDTRAWALSSLAADLFAADAADDAARSLVESTGTGPWYRCLSAAAVIAPRAVQDLADDILAE